jgi:shikimate kinase
VLVFLDASLDELLARLDGTRPLIQSEEDLVRTYRERINLYRRHADITVKTGTEIKEITEKIYEYFGN